MLLLGSKPSPGNDVAARVGRREARRGRQALLRNRRFLIPGTPSARAETALRAGELCDDADRENRQDRPWPCGELAMSTRAWW